VTESRLLEGDCLALLPALDAQSIDLVYLDPPFFTQSVQWLQTRDGSREFSFRDIWESDAAYAEFMRTRLREVARVLRPSGSVFFHCDRNASHIARAVLDDVFGREQFRSEIIWTYRRWSNSRKGLLPAHQTIYFYSRSDSYKFNTIYEEYSASTNVDQILQRRVRDGRGKTVYQRDAAGDVVYGNKQGVPLGDVWDIPYLNPKAKERVGYPTQKPVLLLERIIRLCTDEGDWVLDPFCGSGTTLVAAKLLNRNAIGIDLSPEALKLAGERLVEPVRTASRVLERGRESFREADERALALLMGADVVPVHRNKGIDAVLRELVDGQPVPLRVQRLGETVSAAAESLYRAGRTRNAATMVLIVTDAGSRLDTPCPLPKEILLVEAPAEALRKRLLAAFPDPP
jgi:site-specific DNA-methyltransferase (adenine-specific)